MILDWSRGDEAAAIVADNIPGGLRGFGEARTAAVVSQAGDIAAGLVLHDWSPEAETIEVSAASVDRRWLTRGVAGDLFAYCFGFCQAVVTRTTEDNEPVRKIWQSFGAAEHVIPNLAGRGKALVIYVLTDDAWRSSKWSKDNR